MPSLKPNGKRLNGHGSKWITVDRRLAIYIRDHFTCLYCGKDLSAVIPRDMGLDHLIARSADGSHHETNLVTACSACNFGRQDKPWRKYATAGAVQRIKSAVRRSLNRELAKSVLAGDVSRAEAMRAYAGGDNA
jgi:5-methylcytosine-specific restriction endonuclease McrA